MLILQFLLTAAACFALWALWRAIWRSDAVAGVIVGVGLVGRAFAAQALFWISWLGLPIARSLQIGNGFWFFAIDAPDYFRLARFLVDHGLWAILTGGAFFPSHAFVQLLALFVALFGPVSSVAILLNCAAFVATCAIVVRVG